MPLYGHKIHTTVETEVLVIPATESRRPILTIRRPPSSIEGTHCRHEGMMSTQLRNIRSHCRNTICLEYIYCFFSSTVSRSKAFLENCLTCGTSIPRCRSGHSTLKNRYTSQIQHCALQVKPLVISHTPHKPLQYYFNAHFFSIFCFLLGFPGLSRFWFPPVTQE